MPKQPSVQPGNAVSDALIARIRQLYLRHYFIPTNEIDDLVDTALVDYLRARRGDQHDEQLFLVIAHRRACDFCRRRQRERALPRQEELVSAVDENRVEEAFLERIAWRFARQHPRLDARRFLGVVHALLQGATLAQACDLHRIPRGTQPRYRALLRQCFGALRVPSGPAHA